MKQGVVGAWVNLITGHLFFKFSKKFNLQKKTLKQNASQNIFNSVAAAQKQHFNFVASSVRSTTLFVLNNIKRILICSLTIGAGVAGKQQLKVAYFSAS